MGSRLSQIIIVFLFCLSGGHIQAEMTLKDLIFDESTPYHLKILDVLPSEAKIQVGSDSAKHTIIEFMDYFCGYCKKIHPELIDLATSREDVRLVFLQHPILNETSLVLAKIVVAASLQDKSFELHNAIFSIEGSLTSEKLESAIIEVGLNAVQLRDDMNRDDVEKMIKLSSFLAGGSGARGTPAMFINDIFTPGYLSRGQIEGMLMAN
jgi:protein-disulfide isomerase